MTTKRQIEHRAWLRAEQERWIMNDRELCAEFKASGLSVEAFISARRASINAKRMAAGATQ